MARMIIVKSVVLAAVVAAAGLTSCGAAAACAAGTQTAKGCVEASAGASGSIGLCSGNTSASGSNGNCLRLRAAAFAEVDASGAVVTTGLTGLVSKVVSNLAASLSVGATFVGLAPRCTNSTASYTFCGSASASGESLGLASVPVSGSLGGTMGGGRVRVNAAMMRNDGWFLFDGRNTSVRSGDFKFTVDVEDYSFSGNGAAVEVEFELSAFGASEASSSLEVETRADGTTVVGGVVVNQPRFAFRTTANGQYQWGDVSVSTRAASNSSSSGGSGAARVVYRFPGPFVSMTYDPTAENPENAGQSSGAAGVAGAASAATVAAVVLAAVASLL